MMNLDGSDNLGSDEESGKSWSELEEEARKGLIEFSRNSSIICFSRLADAEKLDYESDHGGRGKKKGGGGGGGASSKKRSPVQSKKRPAHSPPANQSKKKKIKKRRKIKNIYISKSN